MATIADRVTNVRLMLGNRSDLDLRIKNWLANAYTDLGSNHPFEELEDTFSDMLVPSIDSYNYDVRTRAVKVLTLVLTNGDTRELKKRHIINIRRYSTTASGDPAVWAPFKRVAYLRPVPKIAYTLLWDIWAKPQIDLSAGAGNPGNTLILLPDDWLEILDYCAALRGHIDLLERDKAGEIRMLLYGDPKHTDQLGLVAAKLRQKAAENVAEDYSIRPRIRRYTSVS